MSLPVPALTFGLLLASLLISAIGFYRTVLFISIGYAFSITAMVVITLLAYPAALSGLPLAQNLLLLVWSVRLGSYLLRRELLPAFSDQRRRNAEQSARVPRKIQFLIWPSVALLYVAMFSPSLFVAAGAAPTSAAGAAVQFVGVAIMAGGLLLEAVGDRQKSAFKARFPQRFCDTGLYRWVRCPNYLGEILFWVGNWVIAIPAYAGLLPWLLSSVGMICIVLIMIGSTKRLERGQRERYGNLPEYQRYAATVPVLFPLIPVYTLENVRVYLE